MEDYTKFSNPDVGVKKEEALIGIVSGCKKLNVRAEPDVDAEILCVINENAEVVIDIFESTNDFYKVCTAAGIEGYCMTKYVTISP